MDFKSKEFKDAVEKATLEANKEQKKMMDMREPFTIDKKLKDVAKKVAKDIDPKPSEIIEERAN